MGCNFSLISPRSKREVLVQESQRSDFAKYCMFILLKSVLPQFIDKIGAGVTIEKKQIPLAYQKIVAEILNEKAARASRVLFLRNKILTIAVPSSAWACQLRFVQHSVIQEINKLLGGIAVERIVFKIIQ